jgi:hypothetical protein
MTGTPGVVDFFAIEAGEYVGQLDALLAAAGSSTPDAEPLVREARALRGSATMARQTSLAALAGAIEGVALTLRDGRQTWTPQTADALVAAVDAFKSLLRKVRSWSAADEAVASARVQELRTLALMDAAGVMRGSVIVPIGRLFPSDPGPHVLHRNSRPPITADLRFRQAAVPLASTLRRLIAEARHASDDASRRAAGDDLRAALRDLGELAESYDIGAVANFARAREAGLAQLDERALDTVDSAAQALVESAGTVWARRTPVASSVVIEPPAPVAAPIAPPPVEPVEAPAPEPEAPETIAEPLRAHTPASGRALVELLETSISGLHRMVDDAALVVHPESDGAVADEIVPVESLLYRGRAALARARDVRDALRAAESPDTALLDELYDLIDLAALDEPARA